MRKQAFFHTAQKYQWEFQTFCRVQAHQLYAVLPFSRLPFTRFQGSVCQKFRQGVVIFFSVGFTGEVAPGADQFFEVFYPGDCFFTTLLAIVVDQTTATDGQVDLFSEIEVAGVLRQLFNQSDKACQCCSSSPR